MSYNTHIKKHNKINGLAYPIVVFRIPIPTLSLESGGFGDRYPHRMLGFYCLGALGVIHNVKVLLQFINTTQGLNMALSEHAEQVAIFDWVKLNMETYPQLENLFAIPNGGQRSRVTGAMLKAEGVRSGVADMMLAYPSNGYHGLFIELKRRDGGNVSPQQQDWINRLNKAGYLAIVAYGAKEAVQIITDYLNMRF
jgi:hypothetical protein